MEGISAATFLSVREKATRLPKKVLLEIEGKSVTEHLIDRLKQCRMTQRVIMTTSTHRGDDVLEGIARKCDIPCFRGSEEDKLDRYLQAALRYGIDFMVIVDGDDILCDPVHIDLLVERHLRTGADFVTCNGLPLGAGANGFTRTALETVCRIKRERETEVWGAYFTQSGLFNVEVVEVQDEWLRRPDIRMTLDYPEDFQFFKAIFESLYRPGEVFTLRQVVQLLHEHPEIMEINKGVQVLYEQHLQKHTKVRYEIPGKEESVGCVS